MPFPDGASERRTSLLALLARGVTVMSTESELTPTEMKAAISITPTPAVAVETAQALLNDQAALYAKGIAGYEYAKNFSWDSIAEKHLTVYNDF